LPDARHQAISSNGGPCGRRPLSTTMFSTSTRCCIPARSSIIQGTLWRTPRCRLRRNAPSWRPGHPTHRRSLPVSHCGHLPASGYRLPSTSFSRPCANSTADLAIRRAASQIACIQRREPWRLSANSGELATRSPISPRFKSSEEMRSMAGN
jgi:hypothetical protein